MIAVVGLSHRSAPIDIREKLAATPELTHRLLHEFVSQPGIGEALLLSTCNRVELVLVGSEGPHGQEGPAARIAVDAFVSRAPEARPYVYCHHGAAAVRHLFRVTASLDSLAVGEPQILGQVKEAFELARAAGTVGGTLYRVVTRALKAAKRVRSETEIGVGQVSVPTVALDLAGEIFGDLRGRTAVLVGSGEMGESVARLIRQAGARLLVVGRSPERLEELAWRFDAHPWPWDKLEEALVHGDIAISSTSAPSFVIERDMVARVRRARRGRSLFVIDLAVPRDVDPRVHELDDVFLYNVDDLSRVVASTQHHRRLQADHAEEIIAYEADSFARWEETAQVTPTIVSLRSRLRATLEAELNRSLRGRLKHLGEEERTALRAMLHAALNKMLHEPSVRLKQAAAGGSDEAEQLAAALNELFQLDCPVERPSGDGSNAPGLDEVDGSTPAPDSASAETSPATTATSAALGPTRPEAHEAN
ncbi:MAG: glutamyl-tRNA reductase [Polyangiaceae bacterium]|nr:glutamyl-tRNA reductase [Polyangiaceae bacterium]